MKYILYSIDGNREHAEVNLIGAYSTELAALDARDSHMKKYNILKPIYRDSRRWSELHIESIPEY